ncbi:stage II sporulation protein P [Oscillospiraceae bacterium DSM 107454]|uniref:Stage II sporulation protein P n=2 Tax=Ructibacterium gallinarum TaxID=2779355 RepID=A0A9D5M547_9FIRM|nr:stage II sporulation protein P [Ructibacterium gallinarum]
MKKYKAIVLDGKKIIKNMAVMFSIILIFCLLLAWAGLFQGGKFTSNTFSPENMIENTLPAVGAANGSAANQTAKIQEQIQKIFKILLSFDYTSSSGILASEIPVSAAVDQSGVVRIAKETQSNNQILPQKSAAPTTPQQQSEIPPENQAPIKAINASPNRNGSAQVIIGNETSYSVNIDEMLASKPDIDMSGSGPKVLVIHTHATEAYSPDNSTIYDITGSDRSMNTEENVVKAGEALCQVFENKGIKTIHDTELHDYPSFNGSYAHSLAAIEKYLNEYPSIQIVFDVHRDSIVYDDNTKAKVLTEINGKPAAQLMFVVGTDEKGLYHPDWRENIKTAIHFQNAINQKYPTLMRHINLRQERFNGHTTHGSMIIETGSSGNSLSEAIYGLTLAGECIADYLNTLK